LRLLDPARRAAPADLLLVPGIPTPNGPMHLGHVAGPFLRMDVLARFRRLCGDRTYLVSGTDAYESYVSLGAEQAGATPAEVATRYHREIADDLASIDIVPDSFIDPLDARWADRYERWHHHLLDGLRRRGCVVSRRERVPYGRTSGRHLAGAFLAGRCPECGSPVAGTSCEECAAWFSAGTVLDPGPRLAAEEVEWREVANLHLRLDAGPLARALARDRLAAGHRSTVERYLEREGHWWRLTQQAGWGVPAPGAGSPPAVFWTYGLTILAYAALCGEEYGRLSGRHVNAHAPDSGVTTVSAQGIDTLVPDMLTGAGLDLLRPELAPYDHHVFNRFLLLEGRKFSTSRRHAIWTRELTRLVDRDLVRYHLARVSPGDRETDFRAGDFAATVNRGIVQDLQSRAVASWERLREPAATLPDGRWLQGLDALLERQRAGLEPARLRLAEVAAALDAWCAAPSGGGPGEAYWWLKGAVLVAWSLMPRWSLAVWHALGHAGEPALAAFWRTPPLAPRRPLPRFTPVDPGRVRRLAAAPTGHA